MNRSYDRDNDLEDLHDPIGRDREISLGTSMILGIFFLLALLCAAFFGFGYSMGRRSAQPQTVASSEQSPDVDSASSKPSPGSLADRIPSPPANKPSPSQDTGSSVIVDTEPEAKSQPVRALPISSTTTAGSAVAPDSSPQPGAPPPTTPVVAAPSIFVQIAAVSHQEDAAVLVDALTKRGYNVTIRQQPQDKLFHVQIGPFAGKKDAVAMQQRLLTDGYNAIVK